MSFVRYSSFFNIYFAADYDDINCYGKCSKCRTLFLSLFSNKLLVFMAGIYKMLVRIANIEYPDQTLGLHCFKDLNCSFATRKLGCSRY